MANKANLIARLSEITGASKKESQLFVEALAAISMQDLSEEGEAILPGLGKLKVRSRNARTGRNPRTGETLNIPARNVVKFSATSQLKASV